MTIKTRLIILGIFAVVFLVAAPYLVLYSLGYRVDFRHASIVATGGIYIKAYPPEATVAVDGKIKDTTGIFSSSFFVQNLLPQTHAILISKDGYYDYQKNLLVAQNQVTKLEHVILFKKDIGFSLVKATAKLPAAPKTAADAYVLKNNNIYLAPADNLAQPQVKMPLIENVITYTALNGNIFYLGTNGFFYQHNLAANQATALTTKAFIVNKKNAYSIIATPQTIFLQENTNVLSLNKTTGTFETFFNPVTKIIVSPDQQNILFYNDHQIFIAAANTLKPIALNELEQKISDLYWLNNDYIIYNAGGNMSISEIDTRGNINTIALPATVSLTDGTSLIIKSPQIYFNQQDKKLYVLMTNTLLVSERLVP